MCTTTAGLVSALRTSVHHPIQRLTLTAALLGWLVVPTACSDAGHPATDAAGAGGGTDGAGDGADASASDKAGATDTFDSGGPLPAVDGSDAFEAGPGLDGGALGNRDGLSDADDTHLGDGGLPIAVDGGAGADGGGASDGGASDGGGAGGGDDAAAPSCTDKLANGDESDIDCGGPACPACGAGKLCRTDGDCRSGSCNAGHCADAFAPTADITANGKLWRIALGTTIFEVDASLAGQITSFSLGGTNVLVTNVDPSGSVFWTSPQSDWGWPPPPEMSTSAYTASAQDNILTMVSPTGQDGLTISKRFWGNLEHATITIEYTVKNDTLAAIQKAPWEITRVYPGGLTFFPNAEPAERLPGTAGFLAVPFTSAGDALWFKYQKAAFSQDIKSGAAGLEGWAAHIHCAAGLERSCTAGGLSPVLIKQWDKATVPVPGEKEIEIYARADHTYVELEQQGNYQSIVPGATLVWTMHWMLRSLPADIAATPGSTDLLAWARAQLL